MLQKTRFTFDKILNVNAMRRAIQVQDIMTFLGRSQSVCYEKLKAVRAYYNKPKNHPITPTEFCEFYGMMTEIDTLVNIMNKKR